MSDQIKKAEHTVEENYQHFLAYSGYDDTPERKYIYFHGADVGMDRPNEAGDQSIEKEIQDKGLTAPRVTPEHIESVIAAEYITTADKAFAGCPVHDSMQLLTICVLVLKNGFTIIGKSACASPQNFNAEIGAKIARQNAVEQIWALEGYLLRTMLSQGAI